MPRIKFLSVDADFETGAQLSEALGAFADAAFRTRPEPDAPLARPVEITASLQIADVSTPKPARRAYTREPKVEEPKPKPVEAKPNGKQAEPEKERTTSSLIRDALGGGHKSTEDVIKIVLAAKPTQTERTIKALLGNLASRDIIAQAPDGRWRLSR